MVTHKIPSDPILAQAQNGTYPIWIVPDLYQHPAVLEKLVSQRTILVISHPSIAQHYFPTLENSMTQAGAAKIDLYLVPEGDAHKNLSQVEKIWTYCLQQEYRRDLLLVALGGGVVGDLTGFAASCYMRGVDFIQCPTSLLAQIDAAIGGKTGVNHPLGKNLIGSFFSPKAVLIDPHTLNSLPKRDFISGLSELIKYGLILDESFFVWLEQNAADLWDYPDKWPYAIYQACQFKVQVVNADEFESRHRMILNFGHTIGHAIESLMGYKDILHGEAVAIGMVVATNLSCELNGLSYTVLDRLVVLLDAISLPSRLPQSVSIEKLIDKINLDKKYTNKMHWVLLDALGKASIASDVNSKVVTSILSRWKN